MTTERDTAKPSSNSTERVYSELRLMAMTYRFRPDERINEVALAQQLNVSRTPIREALNRLSVDGFVISVPNRGFVGRSLDADDIMELYEYRCIIEQGIVRLACERATAQELGTLQALATSNFKSEGDSPTYEDLCRDEEFHIEIARMTHNQELVCSLQNINARLHFVRWIDLRNRPRSKSKEGHVKLARLLADRESEKCVELIGKVIRRRREEIVEIIRSGVADIYTGAAVS